MDTGEINWLNGGPCLDLLHKETSQSSQSQRLLDTPVSLNTLCLFSGLFRSLYVQQGGCYPNMTPPTGLHHMPEARQYTIVGGDSSTYAYIFHWMVKSANHMVSHKTNQPLSFDTEGMCYYRMALMLFTAVTLQVPTLEAQFTESLKERASNGYFLETDIQNLLQKFDPTDLPLRLVAKTLARDINNARRNGEWELSAQFSDWAGKFPKAFGQLVEKEVAEILAQQEEANAPSPQNDDHQQKSSSLSSKNDRGVHTRVRSSERVPRRRRRKSPAPPVSPRRLSTSFSAAATEGSTTIDTPPSSSESVSEQVTAVPVTICRQQVEQVPPPPLSQPEPTRDRSGSPSRPTRFVRKRTNKYGQSRLETVRKRKKDSSGDDKRGCIVM